MRWLLGKDLLILRRSRLLVALIPSSSAPEPEHGSGR
jgi:hypothetical protein